LEGGSPIPRRFAGGWAGARNPLGLPPIEWSRNNPYSASKVELGRYLYFDKRLSADETISCARCHDPEHVLELKRKVQAATNANTVLWGI